MAKLTPIEKVAKELATNLTKLDDYMTQFVTREQALIDALKVPGQKRYIRAVLQAERVLELVKEKKTNKE